MCGVGVFQEGFTINWPNPFQEDALQLDIRAQQKLWRLRLLSNKERSIYSSKHKRMYEQHWEQNVDCSAGFSRHQRSILDRDQPRNKDRRLHSFQVISSVDHIILACLSYLPDFSDDPYTDNCIFSFNYFFWNRHLKRILFLSCRALGGPESLELFDEQPWVVVN